MELEMVGLELARSLSSLEAARAVPAAEGRRQPSPEEIRNEREEVEPP